jgi:hypothetical protein
MHATTQGRSSFLKAPDVCNSKINKQTDKIFFLLQTKKNSGLKYAKFMYCLQRMHNTSIKWICFHLQVSEGRH